MIKRFIYGVILIIMCTCLLSIGVYAADEVASGACGDNLTWTLYADGEIVIEGTGAMWDYNSYSNPAPWAAYSDKLKKLTLTEGITSIGYDAFYNCSGFTGTLSIPNSVTKIEGRAFYECIGFTGKLTIPENVTMIGYAAFSGCFGFTGSLTIPNNVITIGDYAFCSCIGFNGTLTIPESVIEIGAWAFYGCRNLNGSLTIPDSVTVIGDYAFCECSGFTDTITIPDSINKIGAWAFDGCSKIKFAYFYGGIPASWGKRVFSGMADGFKIYYSEANTSGWTSPTWTAPDGSVYNTKTFKTSYIITWLNDDGSLIDTTVAEYGTLPTHADPNKQADSQYTYTFAGWTPEVAVVTGEATYKATFIETKISYNITGKITSYNPEDRITIYLLQNGVWKYMATIAPETGSGEFTKQFTISNVSAGTYDLIISQPGHQAYTITGLEITEDLDLTQSGEEYSNIILYMMGDANHDGNVDTNDVVAILRCVVGYAATNFFIETANINGDGSVDTNDAVSILRKVVGYN